MADCVKKTNQVLREFLAEFLGTFILTAIGCSVNAVTTERVGKVSGALVPWGWGMALTAAIFVSGGVSGGHVNPAVTLGLASVGKLPAYKIFHYFVAQYLGAFAAAPVTYGVYYDLINKAHNESVSTDAIFGTFPADPHCESEDKLRPLRVCLVDQTVAVSFFLLMICAITDEKNMAVSKGLIPIAIGITDLGLMVMAFGTNCGAPINPARDLAPRLFTAIAGWGFDVFSDCTYYSWVPVVSCHVGGVLGCWIYKLFIECHFPKPPANPPGGPQTPIEKNGTAKPDNMVVNMVLKSDNGVLKPTNGAVNSTNGTMKTAKQEVA